MARTSSIFRLARFVLLLLALSISVAPRRGRSTLTPNTLEHFAEFCRRFIVLDNGKPFELEPFQRRILAGYFAGVTEILVLLPKKNGKTTLLAALALYHLIYHADAACFVAASAVDQARSCTSRRSGSSNARTERPAAAAGAGLAEAGDAAQGRRSIFGVGGIAAISGSFPGDQGHPRRRDRDARVYR